MLEAEALLALLALAVTLMELVAMDLLEKWLLQSPLQAMAQLMRPLPS